MIHTKLTITIGIPAHNEETNLFYALRSLIEQRGDFILEKIIVVSDGSTDGTEAVVTDFSKAHPEVVLVADQERKGKNARLNELCRMNQSDYLMFFDADVVFESENSLQAMVSTFDAEGKVNVVASHEIPLFPETFVERINNAGCRLWDETRLFINGGNHIHNLRGSASMLRGVFAQNLVYPVSLATDSAFLYLNATKGNPDGFRFAYKSHILLRSPNNLEECRLQGTRAIFSRRVKVAQYFGDWVYDEYKIPTYYKVRALSKMMLLDPFFTLLSILLGVYVRMFPLRDNMEKKNTWKMVESTKRAITARNPAYKMKEVY